jgi:hypothetical protein
MRNKKFETKIRKKTFLTFLSFLLLIYLSLFFVEIKEIKFYDKELTKFLIKKSDNEFLSFDNITMIKGFENYHTPISDVPEEIKNIKWDD